MVGGARKAGDPAPEDATKGIPTPAQPLGGGRSSLPGPPPLEMGRATWGLLVGPLLAEAPAGERTSTGSFGAGWIFRGALGGGVHIPLGGGKVWMSGHIWNWQGRSWEMRERLREMRTIVYPEAGGWGGAGETEGPGFSQHRALWVSILAPWVSL